MEAQSGAEIRRLHIVYFLSRKGCIEHPHLVRVHHLSRNGVRLRDIKRWLTELRGNDMPQCFSWSYKRKYKNGYVWQDLMDEDLITPISDNEYVLKGSEISSTTIHKDKKDESTFEAEYKDYKNSPKEENQSHSSETSTYISTKSLSEIEEESPTFSSETLTLADDTLKKLETDNISNTKKVEKIEKSSPFYSTLLNKKSKRKNNNKVKIDEKISPKAASASSDKSSLSDPNSTKSKSSKLRNLITCGSVEMNDSAILMINKQNKSFMSMCSSNEKSIHSAEICKRDKLGGSQRIFGNPNWAQQQCSGRKSCDGMKESAKNKSELRDKRVPKTADYKPVNGPNCPQCGKPFKPEKLHAHMKSCNGLKSMTRAAAAISPASAETIRQRSTGRSKDENSISAYLLAH